MESRCCWGMRYAVSSIRPVSPCKDCLQVRQPIQAQESSPDLVVCRRLAGQPLVRALLTLQADIPCAWCHHRKQSEGPRHCS